MPRRYTEGQLAHVLREANAKDWADVLDFLQARPDLTGLDHDRLHEREDDLAKLKDRGGRFSREAAAVHRTIEALRPARIVPGADLDARR